MSISQYEKGIRMRSIVDAAMPAALFLSPNALYAHNVDAARPARTAPTRASAVAASKATTSKGIRDKYTEVLGAMKDYYELKPLEEATSNPYDTTALSVKHAVVRSRLETLVRRINGRDGDGAEVEPWFDVEQRKVIVSQLNNSIVTMKRVLRSKRSIVTRTLREMIAEVVTQLCSKEKWIQTIRTDAPKAAKQLISAIAATIRTVPAMLTVILSGTVALYSLDTMPVLGAAVAAAVPIILGLSRIPKEGEAAATAVIKVVHESLRKFIF